MRTVDPRQQQRNFAVFLGVFVLGLFGLFADFHASPRWVTASWWITLGGGIPVSIGLFMVLRRYSPPQGKGRELLAMLGMSCLVILLWGGVLTRALPDIYTRLAGDPFALKQRGTKETGSGKGRWLCYYVVHAPLFRTGKPGSHSYCAGSDEYEALPWHGEMVIRGRESWFGKHVDRVEPFPPK